MFKGRHFDRSVILLCVRGYLAYNLSLRNLEGVSARSVPNYTPALSTKHSYLRDEVEPTRFRSAHFTSHRCAEYGWELQRRRYSRPQGFGDRPSSAVAARGLTCDDPLRPAKANLVKVEIRVMWADVVEHTGDGATHPIIEAFS